ncbi:MAG: RpiB/LacA/LacB family sugar-phosphate isomerase [Verrucomicrobia bacterium]|nr:RpiB/LacA/LacB family sugar-phosphate isomerase [Verrucomicrobiota bacterium]
MRIVIGSVVRGFALKIAIKPWLEKNGHTVIDVGCPDTSVFVKFPSIAERAARVLQKGEADLGVLCCGSGTGMALCSGKFAGVCAIAAESPMAAEFGRRVNDANVVCMGESLVAPDVACRIVQTFVETKFQVAPGVPSKILEFWKEAREEVFPKGVVARDREMETLP